MRLDIPRPLISQSRSTGGKVKERNGPWWDSNPQVLTRYNKKQIKFHIDESVRPVAQPHRRVPFHLRAKVEGELGQLMEQDIIERVEGPTPWVSPIVPAPKPKAPDEVRLCTDMRAANKAIMRERHITPTGQ